MGWIGLVIGGFAMTAGMLLLSPNPFHDGPYQPVVKVWRRTETGETPRRQGATTENTGSI